MQECLDAFADLRLDIFFDGTLGAGGHAKAILEAHPEIVQYIGCDRDKSALVLAAQNLDPWKDKIKFVHGNFSAIDDHLQGVEVGGILLDLGVSSMQLDQKDRGFSFSKEGPLDMRMDTSSDLTASDIVNTWSEDKLSQIFHNYGEMKNARKFAKALAEQRKKTKFETTKQFAEWTASVLGRGRKKLHPATLVFQALRIAVNAELESVWQGVFKALNALKPGGRLGVISFHSLEDRIVKNLFRQAARPDYEWGEERVEGLPGIKLLTKKPIVPSYEEVRANPRARSSKLRIAERLGA